MDRVDVGPFGSPQRRVGSATSRSMSLETDVSWGRRQLSPADLADPQKDLPTADPGDFL